MATLGNLSEIIRSGPRADLVPRLRHEPRDLSLADAEQHGS